MNSFLEKKIEKEAREGFFKKLAMLSIMLYIVLSMIFDSTMTSFAWLSSVSIYACLGCCVLFILSRGTFKINYISVILLLVVLILYISTLYTPTGDRTVNMYFHRFWTSALLVILISNVTETKEDVEKIVDTYIFAGCCLSLLVYSVFGFQNLAIALERMDGQLGNTNIIGQLCAYSVVFSVYKIFTKRNKTTILYVLAILMVFPSIMFSGSRKALLVVTVALVVFFLSYSKNKVLFSRIIIAILALFVIVALIYYVPAFEVMKSRIFSMFEWASGDSNAITASSERNRIRYIREGFSMFLDSPIWGNGFFYSVYLFGTYSHNNYIELLMNGGLIFFIAYYSIYIGIFNNYRRYKKFTSDRAFASFLIMMLFAFIVIDIGVVSYYNRHVLLLLSCCLVKPPVDETKKT